MLAQLQSLFATPAEEVGVAAFETNHATTRNRQVDEELIDLILRYGVASAGFTD